jgi:hypothetical protein
MVVVKFTETEKAFFWKIGYNEGFCIIVLALIGRSKSPMITGGQAVKKTLYIAIVHLNVKVVLI